MFTYPISRRSVIPHSVYIYIEFQRKIPISRIKAATKSTVEGCFDFIVHVRQEYDYRFVCEE